MSYQQFNRQETLQKAKERYSKEKAAECYLQNKEAIKEKSKNRYKNLSICGDELISTPKIITFLQSHHQLNKIISYQIQYQIQNICTDQHQHVASTVGGLILSSENPLDLVSIRMSEKTLKFNNIRVNEKEFHKSKQPIDLELVTVDQIVVSDKFKHGDNGFKYFIGYEEDETVKPLCIILPLMSGYMKYFKNGGKSMSFMVKDASVLNKYNEIWNKI